MLLNLIAEGKRLSGAERSAEMQHLIHFAQKGHLGIVASAGGWRLLR
jgi:hypothetical protein